MSGHDYMGFRALRKVLNRKNGISEALPPADVKRVDAPPTIGQRCEGCGQLNEQCECNGEDPGGPDSNKAMGNPQDESNSVAAEDLIEAHFMETKLQDLTRD